MIVFGKGLLGDANSQVIICPVYDDLIFEMTQSRSLKQSLEEKISFIDHRKKISRSYMDVGEYYHYILPEEVSASFTSIYYLMVRSFLKKPYFLLLQNALYQIFLEVLEKKQKSIALPLFSLDCFSVETEIKIIKDAILLAYMQEKEIEHIQFYILGIPREFFSIATDIFSELPENLYSQIFRSHREPRDYRDRNNYRRNRY